MSSFQDRIRHNLAHPEDREEERLNESADQSAKALADKLRGNVELFSKYHDGNGPFYMAYCLVSQSLGHFFTIKEGERLSPTMFNNGSRVDSYSMQPFCKKLADALTKELAPDGFSVGEWVLIDSVLPGCDDNSYLSNISGFDLYPDGVLKLNVLDIDPYTPFTDRSVFYRGLTGTVNAKHTYTQNGKELKVDFRAMEPHAMLRISFMAK